MSGDRYVPTLEAKRLLLVRLGSLGDIVHTLPACREIRRHHPTVQMDWLAERPYRSLLEACPWIDRVWTADTRAWRRDPRTWGHLVRLVRALRRRNYCQTLDFQGLWKSAVLSRLAGAKITRGYEAEQLREPGARRLYSETCRVSPQRRHAVEKALDLVNPPIWKEETDPFVEFDLPNSCQDRVDERLRDLDLHLPLLLNPGAAWSTKRWEPRRFARLAERCRRELSLECLITYGPGESHLVAEINRHLSTDRAVPAFPTNLLELIALCRKSRAFVGGDTGPLHLAVSQDLPVVALLGPAQAWRTGPYGSKHHVVTHERPCPHPYRRSCEDHFCMDLSVDRVFASLSDLLEKEEAPEPLAPLSLEVKE